MQLLCVRRSRRKAIGIEGTSERSTTVRFCVYCPVSFCMHPDKIPSTHDAMTRHQYTNAPYERVRNIRQHVLTL